MGGVADAAAGTCIAVDGIAVVAELAGELVQVVVAALRERAVVVAGRGLAARVALLGAVEDVVPALDPADRVTTVTLDRVPVVALAYGASPVGMLSPHSMGGSSGRSTPSPLTVFPSSHSSNGSTSPSPQIPTFASARMAMLAIVTMRSVSSQPQVDRMMLSGVVRAARRKVKPTSSTPPSCPGWPRRAICRQSPLANTRSAGRIFTALENEKRPVSLLTGRFVPSPDCSPGLAPRPLTAPGARGRSA
jgi:hypothetical protein